MESMIVEKESIILTRYLYLKDEVELAIQNSLLNKSESVFFWCFEYYLSGFKEELIDYLWDIYYDFYAIQYPLFEKYFLKKEGEWEAETDEKRRIEIIYDIVLNLLHKKINIDIFLLRQIKSKGSLTIANLKSYFQLQDMREKYVKIAGFIMNENYETDEIIHLCSSYFQKKCKLENPKGDRKILLLTMIMINFYLQKGYSKSKNFIIKHQPSDADKYLNYEPSESENIKPYQILKRMCKYSIDEFKMMIYFCIERNNENFNYSDNWLYYASFSPIWKNRIEKYNGEIDFEEKRVIFEDEEGEEFYNHYNYDPDEQSNEVKEMLIPYIETINNLPQFINQLKEKYKNEKLSIFIQ